MKRGIQLSDFSQALEVLNAEVAAALQVFRGQSTGAIGIIELLSASSSIPLRLETR